MFKTLAPVVVAVLALLGAACSASSDASPASDSGKSRLTVTAEESTSSSDAVALPAAEQSDTPPAAAELREQVRAIIYTDLVENGVSDASAQCARDTISDETIDAYIEFQSQEPPADPTEIMQKLMEVQVQCLTDEEMEDTGFVPANTG